MNERYDIRGNAYRVKTTLDDGTVLGFPLYEDPETGDEIEGDLQVIDVELFDQPPRQKVETNLVDLQAKVSAARAELSRLTQDVREAEKVGKARLAKLAQYDQLKRLEDFLDGKITHYVMADWGPPKIVPLAETKAEYSHRDSRLLCLFGTTNRSLSWRLNRYNDGSGCWTYVFPCCSLEEAKEVVAKSFADHFAGKSVDNYSTHPQRSWLEAADKAGIAVPAEYRAAVVATEAKSRANEIKNLETKLAELRKVE
jgi:hypothetical protein